MNLTNISFSRRSTADTENRIHQPSKMTTTTHGDTRLRKKEGIPDYVIVPSKAVHGEQYSDDSSIDTMISLEGFQYLEEEDRTEETKIQFINAHTQSLPTSFGSAYNALFYSDSQLATGFESHGDRPPKAPQRRQSIQTCLSCPMAVTPSFSEKATATPRPPRQALAA